jgi:hypothetical protein
MSLLGEKAIRDRHKRLAALDQERLVILAELQAHDEPLLVSANNTADPKPSKQAESLGLSRNWRIILRHLAAYRHFNAGDVILLGKKLCEQGILSKQLTADGVRAQFSIYSRKGFLVRRGGGNYCVAEHVKTELAAKPEKELRAKVGHFRMHKFGPELAGSGPKYGG